MSDIFQKVIMSTHDNEKKVVKESVNKRSKSKVKMTESKSSDKGLYFDDKRANALLSKFFTTNYKNGKSVIVEKAMRSGKKLILEAKVVMKSGKRKSSRFICENFSLASKNAKFIEEGVFMESKDKTPAFSMDFLVAGNKILPKTLSYDYRLTEGTNRYRVVGRTLLEKKRSK